MDPVFERRVVAGARWLAEENGLNWDVMGETLRASYRWRAQGVIVSADVAIEGAGLPPEGHPGQFVGYAADGRAYIMRWHPHGADGGAWLATSFKLHEPIPGMPTWRAFTIAIDALYPDKRVSGDNDEMVQAGTIIVRHAAIETVETGRAPLTPDHMRRMKAVLNAAPGAHRPDLAAHAENMRELQRLADDGGPVVERHEEPLDDKYTPIKGR